MQRSPSPEAAPDHVYIVQALRQMLGRQLYGPWASATFCFSTKGEPIRQTELPPSLSSTRLILNEWIS